MHSTMYTGLSPISLESALKKAFSSSWGAEALNNAAMRSTSASNNGPLADEMSLRSSPVSVPVRMGVWEVMVEVPFN